MILINKSTAELGLSGKEFWPTIRRAWLCLNGHVGEVCGFGYVYTICFVDKSLEKILFAIHTYIPFRV